MCLIMQPVANKQTQAIPAHCVGIALLQSFMCFTSGPVEKGVTPRQELEWVSRKVEGIMLMRFAMSVDILPCLASGMDAGSDIKSIFPMCRGEAGVVPGGECNMEQ